MIYNEKILKLAFNVSELTFLQAKQQIIEDHLHMANERHESHAVIDVMKFFSKEFFFDLSYSSSASY